MTITKNNEGFTEAKLETDNNASLYACYDEDRNFLVNLEDDGEGWYFDEDACREAAEFFTELANELNRRDDSVEEFE